jgi:hypothetical protein
VAASHGADQWGCHIARTQRTRIQAARISPLQCGRLLWRDEYNFFGFWHSCACQPFRDVITTNGDTLVARYEQTMVRLEQITRDGYDVKVQYECEFDDAGIDTRNARPTNSVLESPVSRHVLFGCSDELLHLHYKAREGESIQYVDVISLYP